GARSALDIATHAGATPVAGVVGGFFQRTNLTSNGYFIPSASPSDQENYAMNYYGFTEWNATLPASVQFTAGTVVSRNEFGIRNLLRSRVVSDTTHVLAKAFKTEFTPRAALLKTFHDAFSLYGSVSSGYNAPALTSVIASDNSINSHLAPERAVQVEV